MASAGIGCFPARVNSDPLLQQKRSASAAAAADHDSSFGPPVGLWNPVGSRSGIVWLPHSAEAGLEALSLKVNAEKNQKVLGDFPHADGPPEVFLLANVGSTTTQVYDIHSGRFLGGFNGGSKKWSAEAASALFRILSDATDEGARPMSIAIVGAPGYLVPESPTRWTGYPPEGSTKWHDPSSVDTPITKWFGQLMEDFPTQRAAVLNRTKAANIPQPNCDWGDAYASLPIGAIREVWPDAPEVPPHALVLDLGGGYSRLYRKVGGKITEWDNFRPKKKTNDVLFVDGIYKPERIGALVSVLHENVCALLKEHPENVTATPMTLCIVGTGNAREQELAAAAAPV